MKLILTVFNVNFVNKQIIQCVPILPVMVNNRI